MDIWPHCLTRLEDEFPPEDVHTWLKPLQVRHSNTQTVLYAPNAFVRDEVATRYLGRIRELLGHLAGHTNILLEIGSLPRARPTPSAPPVEALDTPNETPLASQLEAAYTFENFIEGRSNELARATAGQVAANPGMKARNPLLLYGSTGLGKTHLMTAAGNEMRRLNPRMRVLYLRSDAFYNAFFRALRQKNTDQFKHQFQNIDALLIDDIQFFAGKDRTQEEFFHTFNQLFDQGQQIIMTCDRFPKEVDRLDARLRSRLGWGVSVMIDPPDFETRTAIILSKAREHNIQVPEAVAELLAQKMHTNVRDLEGALNTLVAQASLTGQPITVEFAQETLRDLLRAHQQAVSIPNILKTVAQHYGLSVDALLSRSRTQTLARARQLAMALAKELTCESLPMIATQFNKRNHTTVLHACRHINELMEHDGQLRSDWNILIRKLSE